MPGFDEIDFTAPAEEDEPQVQGNVEYDGLPPELGGGPQQNPIESPEATVGRFTEAHRRLAKARLYAQWIEQPLFDGNSTDPIIQEVEAEFHEFANQKMEELLGMGGSTSAQNNSIPAATLTEKEVTYLHVLCGEMDKQQPRRRVIPATKEPVAPVREPQAPAIRKRNSAVLAATKPVPQAPRPVAPPTPPQAPVSKTGQAIPEDGSVIETDGRKLKVRWKALGASNFDPLDWQMIKAWPEGTMKTSTKLGTIVKRGGGVHRLLLSEVATASNEAIPMPTGAAFSAATAALTARQTAATPPQLLSIGSHLPADHGMQGYTNQGLNAPAFDPDNSL